MKRNSLLKFFFLLCALIVGSTSAWAQTTYRLQAVTSVEVGKLYVFEQAGYVMNNTSASSALQCTDTYNTTGLTGTETYVWTLETATGGFYMKNVSLKSNQYLNNASKTTVSFGSKSSKWTFTFTNGVALIQNIDNDNRFLGFSEVGKYKAYAVSNLSSYEHDITVYELVEETTSFTITAVSNNTEWGAVAGTTTIAATPEDGYRVVAGDGGYTVTSGEATVVNNGDNTFSVIPASDCTIQINFEAIPTHTVTWSVNGTETSEDVMEGETITFPAQPVAVAGKTFMGWTETAIEGITDVAPTFVTSATMGTSDLKYYAVYATQSGVSGWFETTLASLTATDVFVIVGDNGDTYAMTNDNGTGSAPSASAVTISDGKITNTVADNIKWNISGNATDGYTFYPNGDDENWLYCTNTNNGVRVGTNASKTFNIKDHYLNHEGTGRYVGIYNSQDWRCYGTINSNISGQSFAFYKYVGADYSGYCTSVSTTATATIPANKEWITFCSTANLDFTSDITGLEGAYTITAHADKATTLTATKMTGKVKAGTGLLLHIAEPKTTAQLISVPVATTGDEQADNMLKGVTADTEVQPTAGDYTNLGLSNGEFHPYSAAGTLAAGKAYLQVPTAQMPTAGNNARLYIVLDGEATGINAIENSELRIENLDAPMYNLAGQRVTKSYKGVVIVNGKKYINK